MESPQLMPIEHFGMLAAAFIAVVTLAIIMIVRAERCRAAAILRAAASEAKACEADKTAAALEEALCDLNEQKARTAALAAELAANRSASEAIGAQLHDVRGAERQLRQERDELDRNLSALKAEIRGFERQIEDLKAAKEQMRQSFGETANALLEQHSKTFKAQNSDQIATLLNPLKEDIRTFKQSLGDVHTESAKQHGALKAQIESLSKQSAAISKEAENLARALKGNVQMQGAWGEMIVDTILQRLGLRDGIEYSKQESFSNADGRARTDYIVKLPKGDSIIIDSKVSLVNFERYVNAEDDDARAAYLASHVRSLRTHVRGLASKNYQSRVGTRLDFVIMFVPIEAALGAAVTKDETLTLDAVDQKVAIATPTTLTTTIQTIAAIWRVERQNQNAEAIAARAGKLYDKFVNFVGDLTDIGKRIEQTGESYEKALTKLSGAGGLVRQAEMLKSMGAGTQKSLPAEILEAANAADSDALLRIENAMPDGEGEDSSNTVQ